MSYSYPPSGAGSVGGQVYSYDLNGNLLSGWGRTSTWTADNQPSRITGSDGVEETYAYDAEGVCALHPRGSATPGKPASSTV